MIILEASLLLEIFIKSFKCFGFFVFKTSFIDFDSFKNSGNEKSNVGKLLSKFSDFAGEIIIFINKKLKCKLIKFITNWNNSSIFLNTVQNHQEDYIQNLILF